MEAKRLIAKLCIMFTVAGASLAAGPAHADFIGRPGRLVAVQVNKIGSDKYLTNPGKIVIEEPGTLELREYRFGGVICSGRNLSESDVNTLGRTVGSDAVHVAPFYRNGQGNVRCLVSFIIGDSEVITEIPQ